MLTEPQSLLVYLLLHFKQHLLLSYFLCICVHTPPTHTHTQHIQEKDQVNQMIVNCIVAKNDNGKFVLAEARCNEPCSLSTTQNPFISIINQRAFLFCFVLLSGEEPKEMKKEDRGDDAEHISSLWTEDSLWLQRVRKLEKLKKDSGESPWWSRGQNLRLHQPRLIPGWGTTPTKPGAHVLPPQKKALKFCTNSQGFRTQTMQCNTEAEALSFASSGDPRSGTNKD